MTVPAEPRILADTDGLLVSDDGRRVVVIDRRTGGLSTTAFVLGVAALVVGGFGVVAVLTAQPSRPLGWIFVAVGLLLAALTFLVVRNIRRRRAQSLGECRPVATLDRKLGLFSYPGSPLLSLDQIRFERRIQIGSSSPKLVAITPAGVRIIKRGNPFDGGIGRIDELLNGVLQGTGRDETAGL